MLQEKSMQIKMDYGRNGLCIDTPADADVFRNTQPAAVRDEPTAIRAALNDPIGLSPLRQLIKPGMRVVIVHTDITRATPNKRLLPVILNLLKAQGIHREDITLLNGLGTHRKQTSEALRQLLGKQITENYNCQQHDSFDDSQLVSLGNTRFDHPISINRTFMAADLKILTGFIEPHFFAGYSGGPKAILPGVAGAQSIHANHSPEMIAHPKADFNSTFGNPIWEEMKEAASLVDNTFLVNVTLNQEQQITGVFTGDVIAAHKAGCEFLQKSSIYPISEPYDLVVTSNSGYPLDQNLYQCVKGLAAAKRAVRKGGAILLVAGCENGLPDHSAYATLLSKAGSPQEILEQILKPGFSSQDAWQVQIQAQVQSHADCFVYSEGLSDDQIKMCLMEPCRDLSMMIEKLIKQYGERVCILPEGPLTIIQRQD
jgi:nickel-dependent lactate racemase